MSEWRGLIQKNGEAADFVVINWQIVVLGMASLYCSIDIVLVPSDVVWLVVRQERWVSVLIIISGQLNLVSTHVLILCALDSHINSTVKVAVSTVIITSLGTQWVNTLSFNLVKSDVNMLNIL
jgi:hypothetical protein